MSGGPHSNGGGNGNSAREKTGALQKAHRIRKQLALLSSNNIIAFCLGGRRRILSSAHKSQSNCRGVALRIANPRKVGLETRTAGPKLKPNFPALAMNCLLPMIGSLISGQNSLFSVLDLA